MNDDPKIEEFRRLLEEQRNAQIMKRILLVGCAFFLITGIVLIFVAQFVSHLLHCPWWLAYLPLVLLTWGGGVLWARGNPNAPKE